MLKLTKQSMTVNNASPSDLEAVRRFIVPVANAEADHTFVARRVWELAKATGARVQFLGLCVDTKQELAIRRMLATMTAMVNTGNVSASAEVVIGRDWMNNLRSRLKMGDMIVYWPGQHAEMLSSEFGVPFYFIPDVARRYDWRPKWFARAAAWAGYIAIIALFFFIQVGLDRFTKNWAITLQVLSVVVEFWLFLVWSRLVG